MAITIKLHPYLTKFTDNHDTITVTGKTVGECIADLERQYPTLKEGLRDEKGKIFDYWDIFLNSVSAYPGEMLRTVKDGDEIVLLTEIGGG